ncbi:MAG: GIY-YIG nuclease family protein [Rhodovibrio sp.]|nr:GIY-YIG nuclease family protein [Rhodovibrio sp.]
MIGEIEANARQRMANSRQMRGLKLMLAAGTPSPADLRARLYHCALGRVASNASDDQEEERRAKTAICRILRAPWAYADKIVTAVEQTGVDAALREWGGLITKPDSRVFGSLYFARCEARPTLVKIGFSQNPTKRAKSLTRQVGARTTIEGCCPATHLTELAIHECFYTEHVRGCAEWYPAQSVPEFLWRHICLSQEQAA